MIHTRRQALRGWFTTVCAALFLTRLRAAEASKLGSGFIPRNFPNFTWADLQDAAAKIAQIGGHASMMSPWGSNEPLSTFSAIQTLCTAEGLAFQITLDPLAIPRTNLSIPPGVGTSFTNPAVRAAYINKILSLASLHPTRLGLAAEVNLLMSNATEYVALVSLTREAYQAVKAQHPTQQMFVSFQWDAMLFSTDPLRFQPLVDFAQSLDVFALTSYPPFWDVLTKWPNYYTCIRQLLPTHPIGISEIGYPSGNPSSESKQAAFYQSLQTGLNGLNAQFVTLGLLHDVNFFGDPAIDTVGVSSINGAAAGIGS